MIQLATVLLLAASTGVAAPREVAIDLVVEPAEVTINVGEQLPIVVRIVNRGPDDVTLVQPGDGSSIGWRTPVIGWWVVDARLTKKERPPHLTESTTPRCGNINSLRLDEIVFLRAGEVMELGEWLHVPEFDRPGKFRVSLHYRNLPRIRWRGIVTGTHDPEAMRLLRSSTEVSLWSNEIAVTVRE